MDQLYTKTTAIFLAVSICGILAHLVVKWLRGELEVSPFDYFFKIQPKATLLMLLTTVGGVLSAVLTDQMADPNNGVQVLAAWAIGYMADSALNRQK